jgi:hypothetical protein
VNAEVAKHYDACLANLNRAQYAYRWGGDADRDRAILLVYDLIGDLQRIRSAMLDERFLDRQRAGVSALEGGDG